MSKTGDTKKRIMERLGSRNQTLTEISQALNLAPSTVSQHLKELLDSGTIRQVGDGQRKWKYYELANDKSSNNQSRNEFQIKSFFIPITAIIVVALLGFALYSGTGSTIASAQQIYLSPGSAAKNGSTLFTVSDSPQSYNISALYITVSNMSVRSSSGKWYSIPLQKQTFNLVSLNNISAILSSVKLDQGKYDAIALYTTNVMAVVNGSYRQVALPSSRIYILESFNISNSSATNWVNIDFNLSSSIRILGNGDLVMMPVISLRQCTDRNIELGSNDIVQVMAPQRPLGLKTFGMDYNGVMQGNFTAPNDIDIQVREGHFMPFANGNGTMAVRMPDGRIIVGRGPFAQIRNAIWTHIERDNGSVNGTNNWSDQGIGAKGDESPGANIPIPVGWGSH